jgi:hypothetical protein
MMAPQIGIGRGRKRLITAQHDLMQTLPATFTRCAQYHFHLCDLEKQMPEQPRFQGTLHIRVTENVTLENLAGLIGRIGGMCGCQTCGLMGVDLRITGGDPVELQELTRLPGVKSVSPQPSPW